ncbi:unnamed protein product [Citrullus colocynthis]|uniref:Uncharacterized protein n=1 Tax=Citrullus colocynthis TaxID=252529 RepID=A0ABP0Y0C9_9ROSI
MQKLCYVRNNLFSVLHDVCTQNPAEAEEDMAVQFVVSVDSPNFAARRPNLSALDQIKYRLDPWPCSLVSPLYFKTNSIGPVDSTVPLDQMKLRVRTECDHFPLPWIFAHSEIERSKATQTSMGIPYRHIANSNAVSQFPFLQQVIHHSLPLKLCDFSTVFLTVVQGLHDLVRKQCTGSDLGLTILHIFLVLAKLLSVVLHELFPVLV